MLLPLLAVKSTQAEPHFVQLNPKVLLPIADVPKFPDMRSNYAAMVKEKQHQADLEAARKAQQALAAQQAATVVQSAPSAPVRPTVAPEPANGYKAFIYEHESGNDPKRWNSSGCVGLGQACPASKLQAVCPNLDYACEDAFFTNYANQRYGGWYNAYLFWINHNWW